MLDNILYTDTMKTLEKALHGTSLRNSVIANNIANVDTPGFKRSEVYFEDELKKALNDQGIKGNLTNSKHIPIGDQNLDQVVAKTVKDETTSYRADGNNVDIDSEMSKLSENTIMYEALSQKISQNFSQLRYAISEGKR